MKIFLRIAVFSLVSAMLVSCFGKKNKPLLVNGAGASFPYILYTKWLYEYNQINPSITINYQSIGSGGGIRQFLKGTLDFGGTDIPVRSKELNKTKKTILHIPTTLGSVAVTYNIGLKQSLNLDGKTLSQIFMGEIKNWNHPKIQKLNPNVKLPEDTIVVVYRADGSGTTSVFTEFLSKNSPSFLNKVGRGKSVNWPVGIGGKGNEGVMGLVNKMKGSISYISLSYVLSQKLPVAKIKNEVGEFIFPNSKSVRQAADSVLKKTRSFKSSLVYVGGSGSYPLSSFTYIIISHQMPREKGLIIVNFLKWCLSDGQKFSEELYFIRLPERVSSEAMKKLSIVQYQ
ncbi:MAG: phosphate ABC transporter substrate-binding protein PstS [Bdellovibrionales bacterium]